MHFLNKVDYHYYRMKIHHTTSLVQSSTIHVRMHMYLHVCTRRFAKKCVAFYKNALQTLSFIMFLSTPFNYFTFYLSQPGKKPTMVAFGYVWWYRNNETRERPVNDLHVLLVWDYLHQLNEKGVIEQSQWRAAERRNATEIIDGEEKTIEDGLRRRCDVSRWLRIND